MLEKTQVKERILLKYGVYAEWNNDQREVAGSMPKC